MSGAAEAKKSRLADLFYETETEYYGMPPFGLLDEVGEGVVGEVMRMFERCPKTLQSRISFLSEAQIEAVYGTEQWAEAVEQSLSRTFELFESYCLKNVLIIPEAFALPHRPAAPADETLDTELQTMLAEFQREKGRNCSLAAQQARLAGEEETLSKLEAQFDALSGVLAAHSIDSLAGTLKLIGGQMESLKAIVADTLEASSNAFAFDDGELPRGPAECETAMEIDAGEFPLDTSVMARLLDIEAKSCLAIGTLADIQALL